MIKTNLGFYIMKSSKHGAHIYIKQKLIYYDIHLIYLSLWLFLVLKVFDVNSMGSIVDGGNFIIF